MKFKVIGFCVAVILSLNSFAQVELSNNQLRGEGLFKWYFLEVYKAKLWADKSSDIYNSPISFELTYLRDLKGEDIAIQSKKELISIGLASDYAQRWYPSMVKIFPDIKKGDSILANYNPQSGVKFYLNREKLLGEITDIEFAKNFLEIWLNEKTSAKELRSKLLGEKS